MKKYCRPVFFKIPVATGIRFDHLNFRIHSLSDCIGDSMFAVGKKTLQVPFENLCSVDDWLLARMSYPKIPLIEEFFC